MTGDLILPLFLILLGLFLLFLEVAIIPGFGVVGIAGLVLLGIGIVVVWNVAGSTIGLVVVAVSVPVFALVFWLFLKSKASKKLSLEDRIVAESSDVPRLTHLVGRKGVAVTPLRPSGMALIGEARWDVKTEGEFLEKGSRIVVVKLDMNSIVVEQSTDN
jgi:membrane-bound serine protease (ClpP class)